MEELQQSKNQDATVKRRDMSIASAIIVLAQILASTQSTQNISRELSEFKKEFEQSKLTQEKEFVRKTEFIALTRKLDRISEQVTHIRMAIYHGREGRVGLDQSKLSLYPRRDELSYKLGGKKLKYDD